MDTITEYNIIYNISKGPVSSGTRCTNIKDSAKSTICHQLPSRWLGTLCSHGGKAHLNSLDFLLTEY